LASLVNKSLIQVVAAGRYRLHELIRQFAAEKLQDEERRGLRAAHAGYFTGWLQTIEGDLFGAEQRRALEQVQSDIENVRAAWLHSIAQANIAWVRRALRSLYQFYFILCWTDEATEMLQYAEMMLLEFLEERAASAEAQAEIEATLASVLVQLGNAHYSSSRLPQAEQHYLRCLTLCQNRSELDPVAAFAKQELGLTYYAQGRYGPAQRLLAEALPLARTLGLHHQVAHILLGLGVVELALGNPIPAQSYMQEALAANEARAYPWGMAHCLRWLGLAAMQAGDLRAAEQALCRGAELCRTLGDRTGEALALNDLGALALEQARTEDCRGYLQRSLELAQLDQNHLLRSRVRKHWGRFHQTQGRYAEAEEHLLQGLRGAKTADSTQLLLEMVLELGVLWVECGRKAEAAELLALVAAHPAAVYSARQRARGYASLPTTGDAVDDPAARLSLVVDRILQAASALVAAGTV
jgi:tetratricopeptide (TPR) repeat protein